MRTDDERYNRDNVEENHYKAQPQQTPPVQETQPIPAAAPQTDPYAGYQAQVEKDYATTLADIRKRRQELENRYQPDIDKQKRVMKIMALGKLIGAIGKFAGGGWGKVAKDPASVRTTESCPPKSV